MEGRNIKVAIWGLGAMGSGMARMLLSKTGVEIVAVCDIAPSRVGRDLYEIIGVRRNCRPPVIVGDDPQAAFARGCADVVLLATDSFTRSAYEKIVFCLMRGLNVISTAEELAYPIANEPELAARLDAIAREHDVTVLGTGINPGFVMDLLVLALTGSCETVEKIRAVRVNDLSPFGPTVMEEQGVGTDPADFEAGVAAGRIAGHVGFPESIRMICDGMGWALDRVEQTREAILSATDRQAPHASVSAGQVAGCRQRGVGYIDGEPRIEMDHPQQICPEAENVDTGDYIEIDGKPNIRMRINPEIPGGTGTIAMCVNMIPHVINAAPGLKTMLDLPVPRALMGDWRTLVDTRRRIAS